MKNTTMKRVALWLMGQMLPREEVFDRHIRHMARGVTWLVCGGMIIAALFLSLVAALYATLLSQGISVFVAAAMTMIVATLGAVICFLLADKSLSRAAELTQELDLKLPTLPAVESRVDMQVDIQQGAMTLLNAFLDGFNHHHPPQRELDLETLHARLTALEAELELALTEQENRASHMGGKDIIHLHAHAQRRRNV